MAGFDYKARLDEVVALLKAHNIFTVSPDLSDGLNPRIQDDNIQAGDPSVTMINAGRLPAIFVRVDVGNEDFASVGETGPTGNLKEKVVTYSIFAFFGRSGGSERYQDAVAGALKMAQNIEGVFQKEYNLGGKALWCNPKTTSIQNVPIDANGATWIKTVMVELEAKYFFR